MLSIKQSRDHVTNQSLYQVTGQVPLHETIRERQLKFTGHCIRMPTDEPANRFFIYESRIKSSLRPGAPRTTYLKISHDKSFEVFIEANMQPITRCTKCGQYSHHINKRPPNNTKKCSSCDSSDYQNCEVKKFCINSKKMTHNTFQINCEVYRC